MAEFTGFSKDLFKFLEDLAQNNSRDWFNANKARYLASVVEPMGDYIRSIAPLLRHISPHYRADPKPHGGSMFRIYRDTRFSKDKTPYKTHAACHFRHLAHGDAHAPGFYMHLEPGRVMFGGGIWRPSSKHLGLIREFIADNPSAWDKLVNSAAVRGLGGVRGDQLKRPPRGYDPDARHIEDLKRKSFFLMADADDELALGPELVRESARVFRVAAKLNHFICDALELPF